MEQDSKPERTGEDVLVTYYDDDNKPIPAEAESSVLMALGMEGLEEENVAPQYQVGDMEHGMTMGSRVGSKCITLEPYHEDPQQFETKRLAALEWLNNHKDSEDNNKMTHSHPLTESSLELTENTETNECDNDDEDYEDGMGGRGFTREATSEDEPWILERILKRRVDKGDPNRRYQYLCKWKYYEEPTWEGRDLLEDEGFLAQINHFDGIKVQQTLGGAQRTKGRQNHFTTVDDDDYFEAPNIKVEARSSIEDALGFDINKEVCRGMAECGMAALYLMSVAVPSRVKAFIQKWRSLSGTHRPTLLYHGTRSKNIVPIVQNGLVVPGSCGVRVANGSAHGIGIYTAESPATSNYFCNDRTLHDCSNPQRSGEMFVCIGLVSNDDPDNVRLAGSGYCIVFFDASFVIPLWLVGFRESPVAAKMRQITPSMPRRDFNRCFQPSYITFGTARSAPHSKWDELSQAKASEVGLGVPGPYRGKPMTKRLIKEAPRMIKDLYKAGALVPPKNNSQK